MQSENVSDADNQQERPEGKSIPVNILEEIFRSELKRIKNPYGNNVENGF